MISREDYNNVIDITFYANKDKYLNPLKNNNFIVLNKRV